MINALKSPAFLRPTSRPSSPAPAPPSRPDSGIGFERSRPLTKLSSLGNFSRRASPAPSPARAATPTPLIQDGSYLEMLSLRLNEAVSRALAQPAGSVAPSEQVAGRRPIPSGRGNALGALIASELNAAHDNPHLQKAILRCLQRPLSVLLTNLSAQLSPLLSSHAFSSPAAPSLQSPAPNAIQLHAVGVATVAGELLAVFDDLSLGLDTDVKGDGLKGVRDGLNSIVARVINPLVSGIRSQLLPTIDALQEPRPGAKGSKTLALHPAIATLQGIIPVHARVLVRYTSTPSSQAILATAVISLIWRGMVAISHRPYTETPSPPASPAVAPVGGPLSGRRGGSGSPPVTPPMSRFTMKLPPSRPPSPPAASSTSAAADDARMLVELLGVLPRPSAESKAAKLAKDAVDEAFTGLKALAPFLDAVHAARFGMHSVDEVVARFMPLTEELPTLVALPVLLHAFGGPGPVSVAALLGLDEDDYRKACLPGFGRAEECATAVGHRVLERLQATEPLGIPAKWLEAELEDDDSSD